MLQVGDKIEEKSNRTGTVLGVHEIDRVSKKFAYSGKLKFAREPKKGEEYELFTTFREAGTCTRISSEKECLGTCEKCVCK